MSKLTEMAEITATQTWLVASFYRFVRLDDPAAMKPTLLERARELGLVGTILLAHEGLNSTLAGPPEALRTFLDELQADPRLAGLTIKYAQSPTRPFQRMKIKLKPEIVTLGRPEADPSQQVGTYVGPQDWNALISEPDVLLVDTRNSYETAIGTFKGALDPQTESFREFPDYVAAELDPARHKRVALFCTGGIRCEKATAWMLHQGFEQVYHLEGGILAYLEAVPEAESLWQGECFVFDERVAVDAALSSGRYDMCLGCGHPVSAADKAQPDFEPGVCCPHCAPVRSEEQKARSRESWRQRQQKPIG